VSPRGGARRAAALLDHELLVVTGKGGVGKTTIATALGVAAARRGLRVIVAEVALRDDVSATLGAAEAGRDREVELAFGVHHTSIDPDLALREYLLDQLGSRTLADTLGGSRAFTYLAAATPGLRELLTIGKVWELAQADRRTTGARPYDLVILDAPATGHGVAVLSAPRTFARTAAAGRIARQATIIDGLISDPARTAVVAVARPEELPVNEAIELEAALEAELGLPLTLVVVNRVFAARFSGAEAAQLAAAPDGPAIRAARERHRHARGQQTQVARLRRGVRCPVVRVHELFHPALDAQAIRTLAGDLERAL
jgi:anion-transporting  ArsA/GET3 family ATPase